MQDNHLVAQTFFLGFHGTRESKPGLLPRDDLMIVFIAFCIVSGSRKGVVGLSCTQYSGT